jgi:hypothetical protein
MDLYEGLGESASEHSDSSDDDAFAETPEACTYVPGIQAPLSPEEFEYYWGEELLTLYHHLKDTISASGWALFERLDYCEFCKFAYGRSSKAKPSC